MDLDIIHYTLAGVVVSLSGVIVTMAYYISSLHKKHEDRLENMVKDHRLDMKRVIDTYHDDSVISAKAREKITAVIELIGQKVLS